MDSALLRLDAITALRVCYLLAAVAVLVVYRIPSLRERFLVYGARESQAGVKAGSGEGQRKDVGALESTLDYTAAVKVPHSWFKHFYMVSVVTSMVWLQELLARGTLLQRVLFVTSTERPSMSFNQLVLCWTLLAIQGSRRLYECIILNKPSMSQMWIGHYLLGIGFYLAMGIAIWIEGAPALVSTDEPLGDARISAPSLSTFIFLPVFLLASGIQHDAHFYLNSLRKYALPSHPAFQSIIAPHYTAECAIYLSLALLAAPKGHFINRTLLAALTFVVIELGVSADTSKRWYIQKFGTEQVAHRWRMIPGIW
jgi:3-oxo-5-alpha-steroid 4-dehydrogenase 3 / polyprenol reductase